MTQTVTVTDRGSDLLIHTPAMEVHRIGEGGAPPRVEEIRLTIQTAEYGAQVVPAWTFPDAVPGLALHHQFGNERKWRISHIASGMCFNLTFVTLLEATQFLAWMAQGAPIPPHEDRIELDWQLSLDALTRLRPGLKRAVKVRVERWLDRRRKREARRLEREAVDLSIQEHRRQA